MAKKMATRELSAAERALLSRKINECAQEQVLADSHAGRASALKREIRVALEAGGLTFYETDKAFARIDETEMRKADDDSVAAIQRIVDPADFEKICPRKVDLKAFDEVVGHHRYPELEALLKVQHGTKFTVGQLAG